MVASNSNRIAWTYNSPAFGACRVAALKQSTDQSKLGGADGSAVTKLLPQGLKMQRLTVKSAAGHSRTVPIYSSDAPILVDGATIDLDFLGTVTTYTNRGATLIPEAHIRRSVTTQTS